jgi:hypothetical protein
MTQNFAFGVFTCREKPSDLCISNAVRHRAKLTEKPIAVGSRLAPGFVQMGRGRNVVALG